MRVDAERKAEYETWYEKAICNSEAYKKFYKETDENPINEFTDDVSLKEEFMETNMGKLLQLIKTKYPKFGYKLSIDESTLQMPIFDINPGYRIICIDSSSESQMRVPLIQLENYPFMGTDKTVKFRKIYLYSDMCEGVKFRATYKALVKLLTHDDFDPRRIINVCSNYSLYYVTNSSFINEFEVSNSVNPQRKPSNGQIAIIAMRQPENERITERDIIDYFTNSQTQHLDLKKFNLYMILSARYIKTANIPANTVTYYITQYDELVSTIILDGFKAIIGAIIKEHYSNHPGMNYNIIFEFDPSMIVSPSLDQYLDNNDLVELSTQGMSYCYIRKREYRVSSEDGYRKDERIFTAGTLDKLYSEEIRKSGYNIMIDSQRIKFIDGLGFIKCYQPRIRHFLVDKSFCFNTQFDVSTQLMQKIDLNRFFIGSGIYEGGYDNLLIQKMMIQMMNSNDKIL